MSAAAEEKRMIRAKSILMGIVLGLVAPGASLAEDAAGSPSIELKNGLVSISFEEVPAADALALLGSELGVEVRYPEAVAAMPVTVHVENVSADRAIALVLQELSLESHAAIYTEGSDIPRQIVLVNADGRSAPAALASEEIPEIPIENEPQYVPPAKEPEYIPPKEEPEFIAWTKDPEYIPPAEPPQEVPPAGSD